jgi:hypothetical protein
MADEASKFGLNIDDDIHQLAEHPLAELNNEYKGKFKLLGKLTRKIPKNNKSAQYVHKSVLTRLEQSQYKTKTLKDFRTSNPADLIVIE